MKKGTGIFVKVEKTINVCDFCKKELDVDNTIEFDFRWDDGYDHYGDKIEVCSVECLVDEIKTYSRDYVFHGDPTSIGLSMNPSEMEDLLNSALGTLFPVTPE